MTEVRHFNLKNLISRPEITKYPVNDQDFQTGSDVIEKVFNFSSASNSVEK